MKTFDDWSQFLSQASICKLEKGAIVHPQPHFQQDFPVKIGSIVIESSTIFSK